jgi:hypothetical protein
MSGVRILLSTIFLKEMLLRVYKEPVIIVTIKQSSNFLKNIMGILYSYRFTLKDHCITKNGLLFKTRFLLVRSSLFRNWERKPERGCQSINRFAISVTDPSSLNGRHSRSFRELHDHLVVNTKYRNTISFFLYIICIKIAYSQ